MLCPENVCTLLSPRAIEELGDGGEGKGLLWFFGRLMQLEGEGGVFVRQSFKKSSYKYDGIWTWDFQMTGFALYHKTTKTCEKNVLDRCLMDCNSAQNNSSATAEIEWKITQKYNDDICLPLCLLFIICLTLNMLGSWISSYVLGEILFYISFV